MSPTRQSLPELDSIRPIVRYVDEAQAVLDVQMSIKPRFPTRSTPVGPSIVDARVEIDGDDGFHDEHEGTLNLDHLRGSIRMEMVHPARWWPAGMGEQAMYRLSVHLLMAGEIIDTLVSNFGLTSVRRNNGDSHQLTVNGKQHHIGEVLPIDAIDENCLLPVSGTSLLVVRDHYGPDLLYQAADRAGILLVQCVPIDPTGHPEYDVITEVARLSSHPSLAGWCVGHLGLLSTEMAGRLRDLDPSHNIYTDIPREWAA